MYFKILFVLIIFYLLKLSKYLPGAHAVELYPVSDGACCLCCYKEVKAVAVPDCLFCKIVNKEIPAEIVYEDDSVLAIKDINPAAPVHLLLIPKVHIPSLNEAENSDIEILGHIQLLASRLAHDFNISEQGYRLVNNCGIWGGQAIFHLHYHLLGGKQMGWPPE